MALGITKFILSDTPYREEAIRVGELVVKPMLARHWRPAPRASRRQLGQRPR